MISIKEKLQELRLETRGAPKIEERDVEHFENRIGGMLPMDYRNFLLEFGECLVYGICDIHEPTPFGDQCLVDYFFGLNSKDDSQGIGIYFRSKALPLNLIAIASDGLDGEYCVSFAGKDRGCVYYFDSLYSCYWDKEKILGSFNGEPPKSVHDFIYLRDTERLEKYPGYESFYFVASTFEQFILGTQLDDRSPF